VSRYHLTMKSGNVKTGPIPVSTTSAVTCPPACPFNSANEGGCYANGGPLALHWRAVTDGKRGGTLEELCDAVAGMPEGQLWRHNQAGDLPGMGDAIDADALAQLAAANLGRNGFTYTHKPMTGEHGAGNRAAVAQANAGGFTVNLSGNNLAHADELAALDVGPVVAVVPEDFPKVGETPAGRRVVVCPAQVREDVSCATCGLCQKSRNGAIVAFRVHGASKRKALAATLV
jgi:hypothetical protein